MKEIYDKFNKKYKNNVSKELEEIVELNEIYYSISEILIKYRKEHNLTQAQIAKKLKVNQTMISKIESGKYNSSFKQIYKISRKTTSSSYMFKEILRKMLRRLEDVEYIINVEIIGNNEKEYKYKEFYNNEDSENIISFKKYYIDDNEGEVNNGKYKSKYTING